jgi:chromate transporter
MSWSLCWRFVLISLLAFGGGAGTPLIEQVAVREQHWISDGEFASAFALGQVTPGPVMVMATFIGYRAAGLPGALAATVGAFLMPWFLGASAARFLGQRTQPAWLRGFGRGAAVAAVGLLAFVALGLIRQAGTGAAPFLIAAVALGLSLGTRVHPFVILVGGAVVGMILGVRPGK